MINVQDIKTLGKCHDEYHKDDEETFEIYHHLNYHCHKETQTLIHTYQKQDLNQTKKQGNNIRNAANIGYLIIETVENGGKPVNQDPKDFKEVPMITEVFIFAHVPALDNFVL